MNWALKDVQNVGFILNLKVQDVRVVNYLCDQRRGTILSLVHLVPTEGNNNKNYLTDASIVRAS